MAEKKPIGKFLLVTAVVACFTIPVFRSGGRTGLTFFQWIKEHSIWGSPIQFVPEEDYARELEGVKRLASSQLNISELMAFYQINEESATRLANRGK